MLTAVDSSVLLDILKDDPAHSVASSLRLRSARDIGAVVACPVVWAEVRSFFVEATSMERVFADAGIRFDPFDQTCAERAGTLWAAYRSAGGKRPRVVADFMIGAHALVRGAALLTRDRGFYRKYFSGLRLYEPRTA